MKLYQGDSRHMDQVPSESVHCIATSPPYWGLRRYAGCPDLIFGGKADCEHEWVKNIKPATSGALTFMADGGCRSQTISATHQKQESHFCLICGSWRGQFGSEPTIDLYLAHSMEFLNECWRVLRKDGILWWNIGDTSASGKGSCFNPGGGDSRNTFAGIQKKKVAGVYPLDRGNVSTLHAMGLKQGELCGIPQRTFLMAQAAGWYVKSDNIWNKTNSMPESVHGPYWTKHRIKIKKSKLPVSSLREPSAVLKDKHLMASDDPDHVPKYEDCPGCDKCLPNDGLVLVNGAWRPTHVHEYILMMTKTNRYYCDKEAVYESGHNMRSVWTFPTFSYLGAHFATFPPELARRCILSSTSEYGVCSKCGKPWARILEKSSMNHNSITKSQYETGTNSNQIALLRQAARENGEEYSDETKTLGWHTMCSCNAEVVPATVLDPFGGSGTTSMMATKLGRQSIMYELSPEYCELSQERNKQLGLVEAQLYQPPEKRIEYPQAWRELARTFSRPASIIAEMSKNK